MLLRSIQVLTCACAQSLKIHIDIDLVFVAFVLSAFHLRQYWGWDCSIVTVALTAVEKAAILKEVPVIAAAVQAENGNSDISSCSNSAGPIPNCLELALNPIPASMAARYLRMSSDVHDDGDGFFLKNQTRKRSCLRLLSLYRPCVMCIVPLVICIVTPVPFTRLSLVR